MIARSKERATDDADGLSDAEAAPSGGALAIDVRHLNVSFGAAHVLKDVTLQVKSNTAVGLVGESGSGKSTLGKTLVGIVKPSDGDVIVAGEDMRRVKGRRRKELTREIQMIPQDPYSSLSPRRTISQTLAEAFAPDDPNPAKCRAAISTALTAMKIDPAVADRYPHEFSGGQRQRIAIARALIVEPHLIIADEITSALDVSVQAEIVKLLRELRGTIDSAMLFISHNLAVVQQVCDEVVVMYQGRIVEHGLINDVYRDPQHDYTKQLLSSIPGSPGFTLD